MLERRIIATIPFAMKEEEDTKDKESTYDADYCYTRESCAGYGWTGKWRRAVRYWLKKRSTYMVNIERYKAPVP